MYATADITYGTNNEFGFDYLRDNMAWQKCPRPSSSAATHYAIVDEVDSILIDEARTPLIISGPGRRRPDPLVPCSSPRIARAAHPRRGLRRRREEEGRRHPGPGHRPRSRTTSASTTSMSRPTPPLIGYLNNAIQRQGALPASDQRLRRAPGGEVLIVDEHTGRVLPGRRYNDGHAPGHRGQGRRGGQGREPDASPPSPCRTTSVCTPRARVPA